MILDTRNGMPRFEGMHDFCIVGAGPAGITMAMSMAQAGHRVLLLEGGDREFTGESQDLYVADIVGHDYYTLDSTRLRYLGGTTGHWGGQCLLLDRVDFEPREDVALSGWPIGYDDLLPYQPGAAKVLQSTEFPSVIRHPLDETGTLERVMQRWSSDRAFYDIKNNEPVRFGTRYLKELEAEPRIDVVVNANVVAFNVDSATGRISSVTVRDYGEGEAEYAAGDFVMAMGAFENARMLLHLNEAQQNRFGNQNDMVGRCFMEHPVVRHGVYFVTRRLYTHSWWWGIERFYRRAIPELLLSPTAAHARKNGWLNSTLRLNRLNHEPLHRDEIGNVPFLRGLTFDEDYFYTGTVWVVGEQAPNPASRILLTDQRDRFGLRIGALDWRLTPKDRETLRGTSIEGAKWLMRTGLGRMQFDATLYEDPHSPELPIDISFHHMGGARMSATAETGVVDADCRVHGASNLYVAGSGIFATGGHANPTFTITQLALRLADHLIGKAARV